MKRKRKIGNEEKMSYQPPNLKINDRVQILLRETFEDNYKTCPDFPNRRKRINDLVKFHLLFHRVGLEEADGIEADVEFQRYLKGFFKTSEVMIVGIIEPGENTENGFKIGPFEYIHTRQSNNLYKMGDSQEKKKPGSGLPYYRRGKDFLHLRNSMEFSHSNSAFDLVFAFFQPPDKQRNRMSDLKQCIKRKNFQTSAFFKVNSESEEIFASVLSNTGNFRKEDLYAGKVTWNEILKYTEKSFKSQVQHRNKPESKKILKKYNFNIKDIGSKMTGLLMSLDDEDIPLTTLQDSNVKVLQIIGHGGQVIKFMERLKHLFGNDKTLPDVIVSFGCKTGNFMKKLSNDEAIKRDDRIKVLSKLRKISIIAKEVNVGVEAALKDCVNSLKGYFTMDDYKKKKLIRKELLIPRFMVRILNDLWKKNKFCGKRERIAVVMYLSMVFGNDNNFSSLGVDVDDHNQVYSNKNRRMIRLDKLLNIGEYKLYSPTENLQKIIYDEFYKAVRSGKYDDLINNDFYIVKGTCDDYSGNYRSRNLKFECRKCKTRFCSMKCLKECENHSCFKENGYVEKCSRDICDIYSSSRILCLRCKRIGYCSIKCKKEDELVHEKECLVCCYCKDKSKICKIVARRRRKRSEIFHFCSDFCFEMEDKKVLGDFLKDKRILKIESSENNNFFKDVGMSVKQVIYDGIGEVKFLLEIQKNQKDYGRSVIDVAIAVIRGLFLYCSEKYVKKEEEEEEEEEGEKEEEEEKEKQTKNILDRKWIEHLEKLLDEKMGIDWSGFVKKCLTRGKKERFFEKKMLDYLLDFVESGVGEVFKMYFENMMVVLFDHGILTDEGILDWVSEVLGDSGEKYSEKDRELVRGCQSLFNWLKETKEEEEEEESEEGDSIFKKEKSEKLSKIEEEDETSGLESEGDDDDFIESETETEEEEVDDVDFISSESDSSDLGEGIESN